MSVSLLNDDRKIDVGYTFQGQSETMLVSV